MKKKLTDLTEQKRGEGEMLLASSLTLAHSILHL